MDGTPNHLHDIGNFKLLAFLSLTFEREKWDVPLYEYIAAHFREVSGFNGEALNKEASTKNFCHAMWILVIKGVGGLSESDGKGKFEVTGKFLIRKIC